MNDEDRYTRITLRLPRDLHVDLTESAAARAQSMNSEIVQRLYNSFSPDLGNEPDLSYEDQITDKEIEVLIHRVKRSETYLKDILFKEMKSGSLNKDDRSLKELIKEAYHQYSDRLFSLCISCIQEKKTLPNLPRGIEVARSLFPDKEIPF